MKPHPKNPAAVALGRLGGKTVTAKKLAHLAAMRARKAELAKARKDGGR